MFNKLSFEELSKFYGSLATLENHYGKEAVHFAVKEMANKLDEPKITTYRDVLGLPEREPVKTVDQLTLFDQKERPKKRKPKQTRQRVQAEEIAKANGQSLDEFIVDQYFNHKKHQRDIAKLLNVDQTSISKWIRDVPQQTIKRVVENRKVEK